MDGDEISLDKRPVGLGKAHLEQLVAACNNFWKIFAVFPNSRKMQKLSSSKIKGYTVYRNQGVLICESPLLKVLHAFAGTSL